MDSNNSLEKYLEQIADGFPPDKAAKIKTLFLKKMSELAHQFYGGKMQTIPKAGVFSFNWFNVWYTPGVSMISTTIRDDNEQSFQLSNRGNLVGVVSDSTRVLGDGDCTPAGGLGVMEGKAFLMKYLAGIDGTALCINNRDKNGEPDPDKIIDFVKMLEPSYGAINLEDISQPNCYKVLDTLREECNIPVWHDDAQGTACVIMAGLINALKLAEKNIADVRTIFLGAGAANSTIARFALKMGMIPANIIMFDADGALDADRHDFRDDPRYYQQWSYCQQTNPQKIKSLEEAFKGADVVIALSQPGPDVIKPEWITSMAEKPIVFVCANPVPEIYPHTAKDAGAFIVATGRGDFPNQVNNSLGFPGILKGALLTRARKITDNMAIAASEALADFACKKGINPDYIIPTMDETEVFAAVAAAVAKQACLDKVARIEISPEDVYHKTLQDIKYTRDLMELMQKNQLIKEPPASLMQEAFSWAKNKA